jgi:hypothetical protein
VTPIEQVQTLSTVIDRDLTFEEIPENIARENMKRLFSAEIVEALFQKMKRKDGTLGVLPTVKEITGRAPRSFKQWANDHANAFI